MRFDLHIGIDYSGAATPSSRLQGLQVWVADGDRDPVELRSPSSPSRRPARWNRGEIADWIIGLGGQGRRFIVGIDHAFSFPASYLDQHNLASWDAFLADFARYWPTDGAGGTVEGLRSGNKRTGTPGELRLTDAWASSAKSVFRFDVQGQVAKSSHAGIPWLRRIRETFGTAVHFWPFDGWEAPTDASVIAEVYPSIFRRRYPAGDRRQDAHDAYSVARWLRDCDDRGILDCYLHPPLTEAEAQQARREGWILGIC